jgi:hypothetical protein
MVGQPRFRAFRTVQPLSGGIQSRDISLTVSTVGRVCLRLDLRRGDARTVKALPEGDLGVR